jgi:hypothetical protein
MSPQTTTTTSGDAAIRPFEVHVPEAQLDDLRRRVAATQWPEKETVADQSQGVPLAMVQELARHWATDYRMARLDHRAAEDHRSADRSQGASPRLDRAAVVVAPVVGEADAV